MNWLERIRQQPDEKKIQVIWIAALIVLVLLIAIWIISDHYNKNVPKDVSVFNTIGRAAHDIGQNSKNIPAYIKSQQQEQQNP